MSNDIAVILIALAAGALYAGFVLAHPVTFCLPCRGKKVRRTGKRVRKCRNCKGTGLARMPGATAVHRFYWTVFGDRILDKRKAEAAQQQAARKGRAA